MIRSSAFTGSGRLAVVTAGRDVVCATDQVDVGVWPDGQDGLAEFHIQF
jgi:hypothetical protein